MVKNCTKLEPLFSFLFSDQLLRYAKTEHFITAGIETFKSPGILIETTLEVFEKAAAPLWGPVSGRAGCHPLRYPSK